MKRSYQQYCAENGALVRSGTFSLAQVGYDVLGLVAPYLDLESLRALMFCLLLEFDVGFNKFLCEVVVSQYSDKQRVTLSEIQRLLEKTLARTVPRLSGAPHRGHARRAGIRWQVGA